MLCIIRERMQTFAYVHQIGRTRIIGTMLCIEPLLFFFINLQNLFPMNKRTSLYDVVFNLQIEKSQFYIVNLFIHIKETFNSYLDMNKQDRNRVIGTDTFK